MSKIRRYHDRRIFNIGISIAGKDGLNIEMGAWGWLDIEHKTFAIGQ